MPTTQSVSINKIIFFVVFASAAIISSLFIFHSNHKPVPSSLSNDAGIIFPAAREIKTFDLAATDNNKFTLTNLQGHWTLLFFGFTHCSSICPTTLDMLNRAYTKLHPANPDLQVVLISVDPERDSLADLKKYTTSFNPDFVGVSGKIQELRKFQSQLGIFSARDEATTGDNYQIQHTSSIMLINPKGQWAGLFKFGLNPDQFVQAYEESMRILGSHDN